MYNLRFNSLTGKLIGVMGDAGCIPIDPNNRHYREFLDWNAAQPTPLVLADQAPPAPDPMIAVRAAAQQALATIRAKPPGQRTAADRAALIDAVADLLS